MFLLDTDALSDLEKPRPDPGLSAWLETVDWLDLYLSVITVGELWKGIASLPKVPKRHALEAMFELIPDRFFNRNNASGNSNLLQFFPRRGGTVGPGKT